VVSAEDDQFFVRVDIGSDMNVAIVNFLAHGLRIKYF
jgi:hypothetical protein